MATATRRVPARAWRALADILAAQGEIYASAREFLRAQVQFDSELPEAEQREILRKQEIYGKWFEQRATERLRAGAAKAMKLKDPEARRDALARLLERERRLAAAHAAAMVGRLRGAERATIVRMGSPEGAFWARHPHADSCKVCRFMDNRLWPWETLERIAPPVHPQCRCTLYGVEFARGRGWIGPDDQTPTVARASKLLKRVKPTDRGQWELTEAAILAEAQRRGLYREAQHRRDREGQWTDMPGVSVGRQMPSLYGASPERVASFAKAIATMNRWTRSDVEAGRVPGVQMADLAAGVAGRANLGEGTITLTPSSFNVDGTVDSVHFAHEVGHYLSLAVLPGGRIPPELEAMAAGSGRAEGRYGQMAGSGSRLFGEDRKLPEEFIADSYADIVHGRAEFSYIPGLDGPDDPDSRAEALAEFNAKPSTVWLRYLAGIADRSGLPARGLWRFQRDDDGHYRLVPREPVQEAWTLSPAALARKAERQRRDRQGRFADEGLLPGVGRRAPGWMDRDLTELTGFVGQQREWYPKKLTVAGYREIGAKVDKIAKRYSKSVEMRKQAEAAKKRSDDLFQIGYDRWIADENWGETKTESGDLREPQDYLDDAERREYDTSFDLQLSLLRGQGRADAEAHLGVLRKLRPMGGQPLIGNVTAEAEKFSHDELTDIDERFAESLVEIGEVLPTAWVEDVNAKGKVDIVFSKDRAWCSTSVDTGAEPDPYEHSREQFAKLGAQGYKFLGEHREYGFLMFRRPDDGHVIALNRSGEITMGVGDFAETPVVLDAAGNFNLPQFVGEPPTADQLDEFIARMANIPPRRIKGGKSAMGVNWDAYERMREAVARYESEGWTLAGTREPWAVLRKGDEEITLNWEGKPFGTPVTDPLNPYGQVPLPPLPVRINSEIKIDPKDRSTLLHEYGHRIEAAYGEEMNNGYRPLMGALLEFLSERRTAGRTKDPEPLRKLSEITGNDAYDDHEIAFEDKFVHPYIGKEYRGAYATEVLTMGLQGIFYPTHRDRLDEDDDMRHFILGLLAAV